jgi:hypothetical protein
MNKIIETYGATCDLANTQLTFIASIKEKIRLAQYETLKEVNTQLIRL